MGAPVRVILKDGTRAVVTALGPRELTPYNGGATLPTSTPGSSRSGVYHSGSAQVTWRHDGHVLGVWVFTIELD